MKLSLLCTVFMTTFSYAVETLDIHVIDLQLTTRFHYFKAAYPKSSYALLTEEEGKALLVRANNLKRAKNLDHNTALAQALEPKIDPKIVEIFHYFKATYPRSPYALLTEEEGKALLVRANNLKRAKNLDNNTALAQALEPEIDPKIVEIFNYYKAKYLRSPYALLTEEEGKALLVRANNLKKANKDLDNGTALAQALNRSIAEQHLKDMGYINFTAQQLKTVEELVGVLGVTKQRLEVAVHLTTLGFNNLTVVELDNFDDAIKNTVLKSMAENPVHYNNLNTLDKLQAIFASCDGVFLAPRDIVLFASRVNSEHLFRDNLAKQIKHVKRAYALMTLNQNTSYDSAMNDRRAVYEYMVAHEYDTDVDIGDGIFDWAINEIKAALRLGDDENMRLGDDISVERGLKIIKLNENMDVDISTLKRKFENKTADLKTRLYHGREALRVIDHHEPIILNRMHNIVNYDDRIDQQLYDDALNPHKIAGAYYIRYHDGIIDQTIDIKQDTKDVINEVDRIALTKAANPIRLNYKALTYQDYLGTSLQRNLGLVSAGDFNNIKIEALGLVDVADFGDINLAQAYINEINQKFDRVTPNPLVAGPEDSWKEQIKGRINLIWTMVPEALIDARLARPGTGGHDPIQWQNALRDSKKLVLQNIIGAIADCNTGVNQKLGLLEQGWRPILGGEAVPPYINLIAPVAAIVNNLKMKRIEELGKNPGPKAIGGAKPTLADEVNVTAPALIHERVRIGWGLGGDFQEIVGPRYGFGYEAQNSPAQITRNLLEGGQPARRYNTGTEDAPVYDPLLDVAVDAPMSIKTLVKEVYDEFDKSILYDDLMQLVKGDFDLTKDQLKPTLELIDGVFINNGGVGIAKNYFSPNMAFAVLEKLNYIEMLPAAKTALYGWTPADPQDFMDDGTPGTYLFNGHTRNLHEWIESDDL